MAYVVVLLGIPSELIVRPLGAAGTPAQIIGIGLLGWWLVSRVVAGRVPGRSNPIKWLLLIFVVVLLASYVAGMTRPITFSDEVRSADRALLSLCAWCGVVLVLTDGLNSLGRLERLLRVVAGGVTGIAILGMLQFFFHIDLAHYIHVPGLSANHTFGELLDRSRYRRVSGTTSHPIEFGVVLSSALPLVIHFARYSPTALQRRWWWAAVAIVSIALPFSVARSAILGGLIAILYLFHTWPPRLQIKVLIAGSAGAIAMSFVVPGLLGTIRGLFLNASSDPSTQGRTADYAPVFRYVGEHLFFGRGFGTFLPSLYRTLDNQYLGTVADAGIVGLLGLLTLFIGTACVAGSIRRRTASASNRDLGQCLKAGIVVMAVNAATFDAFGFSMCAGMIFLFVGATGALWTVEAQETVAHRPLQPVSRWSGRWFAVAAVSAVLLLAAGARGVMDAQPQYQAYGTVLLTPPPMPGKTLFATSGDADTMTSLLHDMLASGPVREKLHAEGAPDYEVAVGNGSLMMGTDVIGTGGPTLHIVANANDAATANAALSAVIAEAGRQLAGVQARVGVPTDSMIRMELLQQGSAFPVGGRPTRAHAALLLLIVIVAAAFYHVARQRAWRRGRPKLVTPRVPVVARR